MARWQNKEVASETQTESKQEVAPEVTKASPTPMQPESKPTIILTETDAYIHERMKGQPQSIDVIVEKDWSEPKNILALPTELEKFGDRYAFRWINKKKRAIDHALDVTGWNFVTRVIFKELPSHLFTANGSIERGDAILAFMPIAQAQKIRLRPAEISRERVRNTPVQNLRTWEDRGADYQYKPELGSAEKDNEVTRGITRVPDQEVLEEGITEE